VVLFHGYGANAEDLLSLNEFLDPDEKLDWYFPDGILSVLIGPGMSGRAWFDIDIKAMEEAMMKGTHRDLSVTRPKNMEIAVSLGLEFLDHLLLNYKRVVIGGFSQGSMLATEIFFRTPKKPNALIILSGNLVDESTLRSNSMGLQSKPYFISHGQSDPILGFRGAEKLHLFFKDCGMLGKFYQFQGGHEIPMGILVELKKFLQEKAFN